jgi:signal transduction histidine kinase/DNA-binding response OmpR family regulator
VTSATIPSSQRPIRILVLATALMIVALASMSFIIASNLRDDALKNGELALQRHTLALAGQADRSFQSIDLILSNINDHLINAGVVDSGSYEAAMGGKDTFEFLQGKLVGLPQLDAITMINKNGKLINFSRYWPIPEVNVSDRDYFAALRDDPKLLTYVSKPVQNRGTGTWTIYIARRVNGANGQFTGLILAGMSLQYFEDFYRSVSLGEGSSAALIRDDGTLLARYPRTADNIGKVLTSGSKGAQLRSTGGFVREMGLIDNVMRLKTSQRLSGVPLLVLTSQTEEGILRSWRQTVKLLFGFTGGMIVVLALASAAVVRQWRQQQLLTRVQAEKAEAEKAKALAETELLRQQERTAEAANRAKSNFLAVMSHEIRTPMNAVLGLTSTLLEADLSRDQRESIQAIHTAGDNLLEILNDILDFSKLETGKLSLEAVPFSVAALVESALGVVGASAAAKGLEVRVQMSPDIPAGLLGDAGRIRQILLNLASNAIKFTSAGEIVIKVECLRKGPKDATLRWSVADGGIGIPPDRIGALFNDFIQADSSINRRFGGSGLGLAICRRIVEQMGGEIGVESEIGRGSTFRIELTLPIAVPPAAETTLGEPSFTQLKEWIEAAGRPLRILIVDDNHTNRLVAAKMYGEFAVRISEAGDGAEAVKTVASDDFDIVLMDMQMPEMDGLTATSAIRAMGGKYRRLPIIAFTANAFADDREACEQAGMTDFVAKPVRKTFLIQATLRALRRSGAESQHHGATAMLAPARSAAGGADTMTNSDILDPAAFEALAAEIDMDGAVETFKIFAADTRRLLASLSKVEIETSRKQVQVDAHSLKSTAATFGFRQLSALAKQLEHSAMAIPEDQFLSIVPQMDAAFERGLARFDATFKPAA